jgi:hypothetical protein
MTIIENLLNDIEGVDDPDDVIEEEARPAANDTVAADHDIDEGQLEPLGPTVPDEFTVVEDWEDLDSIRDDPGSDYALANDLDENTAGYEEVGVDDGSFEPISGFSGTFDGQNNTIADAQIGTIEDVPKTAGLFDEIEINGLVENLVIEDFEVFAVGTVFGDGGGAPLAAFSEGTIRNVHSHRPSVTVTQKGSGLVADTEGHLIEGSSAQEINLVGDTGLGGLVAAHQGTIERSFATGELSLDQSKFQAGTGGLVGEHAESAVDESVIANSYSLVDVTINDSGSGNYGGLVGSEGSGSPIIKNSFAAGELSSTEEFEPTIGGLVGSFAYDRVTNSFWDTDATGQDNSAAGMGLETEEIQGGNAVDNLDGFDFENDWETTEGYPELR